ncbi:MAG TPA: hypothetical protein VM733_18445, partial [Thermoanaerobaculia bacterium]|nr:hypothetical protein [Thermoanaerobaculia bacterium]
GDVRLFGAVIDGDVSGQAAKIGGNVLFRGVPGIRCRVRGAVWLVVAKVAGALDVSGIRVQGGFVIASLTIGASLRCVEARVDGAMVAENAHIDGSVDIYASTLAGVSFMGAQIGSRVMLTSMDAGADFSFDGATVGGDLYCNSYRDPNRRVFIRGSFTANGATIRGGLVFESVTVAGGLQLQTATVAQSFILRTGSRKPMQRSEVGSLWLLGLRVGGAMDLSGTRIHGDVLLPSAVITQNVLCTTIRGDATEITGDLHLSTARIGGAVNVAGARIGGSVQASSAAIDGELTVMYGVTGRDVPSLQRTTIGGSLEVLASTIAKEVCLAGMSVTGNVTFAGSQLNGRFTFDGSSVAEATVDGLAPGLAGNRRTDLIEQARTTVTTIDGDLHLQRAKISGGIALAGARIGGTLDLRDASVRSNVETAGPNGFRTQVARFDCETLELVGDMDLTSLDTTGDVVLRDASILGSVIFSREKAHAGIGEALRCNGASITDLVFSGGNFVENAGAPATRIVLERARLGRLEIIPPLNVTLDLRNMRADRVANLDNRTDRDRATVPEILDSTSPFEKGNYLAFENAFRNAGRDHEADEVHVAMRRRDRKLTRSRLRRAFDWFLDITIGYGTTSQRVAIAMLVLFFCSVMVFRDPSRLRLDIGPSFEHQNVNIQPQAKSWNGVEAAIFAAQLHVPIISLGVKNDVEPSGKWWRVYAMTIVALHWVMWPLLIASLSGLVRKKT